MRELNIGTKKHTKVIALDKNEASSENHVYQIINAVDTGFVYGHASFQNGPVKENGVNGCHNEDLIAIVIDRLQGFQSGEFACRENALALTKLEEALHWLRHRTLEREARGVEGTSIK